MSDFSQFEKGSDGEGTSLVPETSQIPLYACDSCSNAFFTSVEQLQEHISSRHSRDIFPDYAVLESVGKDVAARWSELQQMPVMSEKLGKWGEKAFALAKQRDAGLSKMLEAHRARAQLEVAVQRWHPSCKVYIFGSSVSLGVWDGTSDIDFTVVDVDSLEQGLWNPNEKSAVRSIATVLFKAGFTHQNLELIPFARVPIIKHHANTPLIPKCIGDARGNVAQEAEDVVSRSVRFSLASAATPADRLLIEAGLRAAVGTRALQHSWWNRTGVQFCATFSTTTDAMRALTATPVLSPKNRCIKVGPLHEDFRPELFNIDFDLSFRVFGIRNSVLLRQYLVSHPCGRPGSVVLKDWSKTSGVNNSHGGFLTSYAINILWIYYLVRRGVVPYIDPLDIPASLQSDVYSCDPQYVPMEDPSLSDEGRRSQQREMGTMLADFFKFYATEFDWKNHVVSLNREEVTTKQQLGWDREEVSPGRKHTRYELCIEDPYEDNLNLGRHLGPTKAKKVVQEFFRGFLSLIKDSFAESCVFELVDTDVGKDPLSPPAAALIKLTMLCAVAFEEKVQTLVESRPSSSGGDTSAEARTETVMIPVVTLKQRIEMAAPAELALVLKCWSWPQLLFRLGYKCIGGQVYRRGTFGSGSSNQTSSPISSSEPPVSTATSQVRDILLQELDQLRKAVPQVAEVAAAAPPLESMVSNPTVFAVPMEATALTNSDSRATWLPLAHQLGVAPSIAPTAAIPLDNPGLPCSTPIQWPRAQAPRCVGTVAIMRYPNRKDVAVAAKSAIRRFLMA